MFYPRFHLRDEYSEATEDFETPTEDLPCTSVCPRVGVADHLGSAPLLPCASGPVYKAGIGEALTADATKLEPNLEEGTVLWSPLSLKTAEFTPGSKGQHELKDILNKRTLAQAPAGPNKLGQEAWPLISLRDRGQVLGHVVAGDEHQGEAPGWPTVLAVW